MRDEIGDELGEGETGIELEGDVRCGRCGDEFEVIGLTHTDTWHEEHCSTCGMEYAVTVRIEW